MCTGQEARSSIVYLDIPAFFRKREFRDIHLRSVFGVLLLCMLALDSVVCEVANDVKFQDIEIWGHSIARSCPAP